MSGNEERTAKKHAIYALVKEKHCTFVGESVHRRRAVGSAMGGTNRKDNTQNGL